MRYRVLLVDDHAAFRAAARALLSADGFEVVAEAATAREALLAVQGTRLDLVLLDVRLPGRDGIDAAADIALLPHPPHVVLVSSRPASAYGSRLRAAPVRGFLTKADLGGRELRRLLGEQRVEHGPAESPAGPER